MSPIEKVTKFKQIEKDTEIAELPDGKIRVCFSGETARNLIGAAAFLGMKPSDLAFNLLKMSNPNISKKPKKTE